MAGGALRLSTAVATPFALASINRRLFAYIIDGMMLSLFAGALHKQAGSNLGRTPY